MRNEHLVITAALRALRPAIAFAVGCAAFIPAPAPAQQVTQQVVAPALAGIPHPPPARRPVAGRLGPVFRAVELRDWDRAYALASNLRDPVLTKVVSWARYTTHGERMEFGEVTAFIKANPDWPAMNDLLESAEETLVERIDDDLIIGWFTEHPPRTPKGAIHLANALLAKGRRDDALTLIRKSWVEMNFSAAMERVFYSRFRKHLTADDHKKRIDRLLWDGRSWEARRVLRRIKGGYHFVALARMRLRAYRGGVDWAIRRVPDSMAEDPGLVYERLRWRRRKGRDDEAIAMIEKLPDTLPRPELVWHEQGILARRALRDGKVTLAYSLAAKHRQTEGKSFADAEFLAGFIALRFLKDPKPALDHFTRLFENVNFPVSKARGAYWAGRAARALKREAAARNWFNLAARHVTTFYGQLALAEIALHPGPAQTVIAQDPDPDPDGTKAFAACEIVRAAELIAASTDRRDFKVFIRHLVKLAKTPAEHALVSDIALAANRADAAVWAAKDSLKEGVHLIEAGWPRVELPQNLRGLEPGLILALMRQESAFDVDALSWAGARGLMQVMPATARRVAKRLGLPFSRERLLNDPDYNMAIGTAYISQVVEEFSGSYVLALAAYNAGPSRARRWLRRNGDFRKGEVDAIDWIELIPFEQTRDYVQRVIENIVVYRALYANRKMRALHPAKMVGG
jgi:soluble lytic murein transglycosylase